jgi:flavoprotein
MPKYYDLQGCRRFVPIDWQNATLNTIPHHNDCVVECRACGTVREMDRAAIPASLQHSPIRDIERRLACKACKGKQARLMFGYFAGG